MFCRFSGPPSVRELQNHAPARACNRYDLCSAAAGPYRGGGGACWLRRHCQAAFERHSVAESGPPRQGSPNQLHNQ